VDTPANDTAPKALPFSARQLGVDVYPFEIKCYVSIRPNLRTDALEMEMYVGRGVLDAMYDRKEVQPKVASLVLSYPERWLNILEQRQIYERCKAYLPNLKQVSLKTHSPFIIQCTPAGSVFIVDAATEDESQSDVGRDLFGKNVGDLFDLSRINQI
jgi:hypothetical protein